jgi:hypothetical protein
MEWYQIVGAIAGTGGFILIMHRLLQNKILEELKKLTTEVEKQGNKIGYNDGRLNAIFMAIEKTIGNGFSNKYHTYLKDETDKLNLTK